MTRGAACSRRAAGRAVGRVDPESPRRRGPPGSPSVATKYAEAAGGEDAVVRPGGEGEARRRICVPAVVPSDDQTRSAADASSAQNTAQGAEPRRREGRRSAARATRRRTVARFDAAAAGGAGGDPQLAAGLIRLGGKKTCPPDSANGRGRESLVFRLMSVSSAAPRARSPRRLHGRRNGEQSAALKRSRRVRGRRQGATRSSAPRDAARCSREVTSSPLQGSPRPTPAVRAEMCIRR